MGTEGLEVSEKNMTGADWKITATRPVLIVSDITKAIEFYIRIGFEEAFRNDIVYAVMRMGDFTLHLGTHMEYEGAGQSQAVIEIEGVEAYYAFCRQQGVEIERELQEQFYGMVDFRLRDPDGNVITFGEKR